LVSRFQEQGLIEVIGRQVRLLDPNRLHAMANSSGAPPESLLSKK